MHFEGTVFRYGRDVDTDVIIPARYLNSSDHAHLAAHAMEDLDPTFATRVQPGDIVVAEENFGCGSSREHAVYCLEYAGVPCVLAETCSRIYYRNAINNGYPVLFVKGLSEAIKAGKIKDGDELEVELSTGTIKDAANSETFHGDAVSNLENDIMQAGGLMNYMKAKVAAEK